jgi:hypothetical protein
VRGSVSREEGGEGVRRGEWGEWVRHVYGSDDDGGGRGRVFIGCADGGQVIMVKLLNKLVGIDV